MNILVINCGSSSIKYKLYEQVEGKTLIEGVVARIGEEEQSYIDKKINGEKKRIQVPIPTHKVGFETIVDVLLDKEEGVISEASEISAVGHRVVHGGDMFTESTLIDDTVIAKIEECIPLAPLHNPANLVGIREAQALLSDVPHVAVFDTSFHQTMPEESFLYALPFDFYKKNKIRRYGFHGSSYRYVSQKVAEIEGKNVEDIKMIICHLGNGASVAAINKGKSIDTTMGMTPLEGLVMGTRCGDIDPGVLIYMSNELNMSTDEIDKMLNKESGVLGISGVSNDFRDLWEAEEKGNKNAEFALKMFNQRVKKYIGAYFAELNGIDYLVFTAGIGENDEHVRSHVCENMEALGIKLDLEKNLAFNRKGGVISTDDSPVKILIVPTDEELMIIQDTVALANKA
jgi:acetate kinase